LANEITKLHGGVIDVNSEVNVGSEFVVSLSCGENHLGKKM